MNILAAADLHGRHRWYEALLEIAGALNVQAIVLAGDLLGSEGLSKEWKAQKRDARKVRDILHRSPVPVLYIMGNDDFVELGPNSPRLLSIHGRRLDLGGFNFLGYQFSLPFMGGVNEKTEEAIAGDLELLAPLADVRTVLVTHGPALGHLDLSMLVTHVGSASILDFVEHAGVRAHLHGHLHENHGRDGRHFNVAALPQGRAMFIDLEQMTHRSVELARS
jgi:Icc-related predicted phosphoesterase